MVKHVPCSQTAVFRAHKSQFSSYDEPPSICHCRRCCCCELTGQCRYPFSHSSNSDWWFLVLLILFSSSFFASAWWIHHIYIAESAFTFTTTIADTGADDVAIMSIESEGNFNQAMANMLRGSAGVVSLRNNKDSFNEVEEASLAQCKNYGSLCWVNTECCEYK